MGVTKENRLNDKQKEALLKFMEEHPDFGRGRTDAPQASQVFKNLWQRLRDILNKMPGATKDVSGWKEVWSTMRSEARQYACSNGVPKPTKTGGGAISDDEEDEDGEFETDSPFVNRIMAIIGWEAGMGLGVRDDLATSSDEDEPVVKNPVMNKQNPVINYDPVQNYRRALANLLKATEKHEAAREELNSLLSKVVVNKIVNVV